MKNSIKFPIFESMDTSSNNQHFDGFPPRCNLRTKTKTLMVTMLYTFMYLCTTYSPASAQVIHQSFEIGDRKAITLSLDIPYEVETWAGNTVLTETKIKMENIPPNILKHFINEGRYEIVENLTETSMDLKLKEMKRRPIRTKKGEADEQINIRIFVPEDCNITRLGKGSLAIQQIGEK